VGFTVLRQLLEQARIISYLKFMLGCVDSSFFINDSGCQVQEAKVAAICFILSGGDSPKAFEFMDVAFNDVPQSIELPLSRPLDSAVSFGRYDCPYP
jgi:hypothetical protein